MRRLSKRWKLQKVVPYIFVIAGVVGCLASFALTYDKIQVLKNPAFNPSCNINPILSCGSVMSTEQASLLGVPNTIFGLIAFTMLFTFGFVLLAGAKLSRWIWVAAEAAAFGGVIFMHYLFFQGVYRINAICPWCFVVWMITIPVFWYTTVFTLQSGYIKLPQKLRKLINPALENHLTILLAWYAIILFILLERFWYYWSTLL